MYIFFEGEAYADFQDFFCIVGRCCMLFVTLEARPNSNVFTRDHSDYIDIANAISFVESLYGTKQNYFISMVFAGYFFANFF
jgi:hypothetical protein